LELIAGGIGGVHRGAEFTFDISSDLRELGRSSIAVVSAGVKSILDIGKTLEYLVKYSVMVPIFSLSAVVLELPLPAQASFIIDYLTPLFIGKL
jgi:pseudouridine-5'-phosphate glycosidase